MENQNNLSPGYELAARYLAGEAGPEEAMQLDDWRKESNDNEKMVESISAIWLTAGQYEKPNIDLEWERVRASMPTGKSLLKPLLSIAAIAIIVATALWFALIKSTPPEPKMQFTTVMADTAVKKLQLPDSSRVTLNTGSTLTSPVVFAENARSVSLKGEAFFAITSNPSQPFMVSVDDVTIKVIGTSFNVNATDSFVQVSVAEGTVMMLSAADSIVIKKGQSGMYERKNRQLRLVNSMDINDFGYATYFFRFDNVTLNEAKRALEKAYKIDIIFTKPALGNCRIIVQFDNVPLDRILYAIAMTYGAELKKEGQTVYLTANGCQ